MKLGKAGPAAAGGAACDDEGADVEGGAVTSAAAEEDDEEAAADLLELLLPLPWGLGDGDGEFGDSVGERLTGAVMAAIEEKRPPKMAATREKRATGAAL